MADRHVILRQATVQKLMSAAGLVHGMTGDGVSRGPGGITIAQRPQEVTGGSGQRWILIMLTARDSTEKNKYAWKGAKAVEGAGWGVDTQLSGSLTSAPAVAPNGSPAFAAGATDGDVVWATSSADSTGTPIMAIHAPYVFGVQLVNDGGVAGSDDPPASCTFTYTLKSRTGETLRTGVTPEMARLTNITYTAAAADSWGLAMWTAAPNVAWNESNLLLLIAFKEIVQITDCGT